MLQQPAASIRPVPDEVRHDAEECARVASLPVRVIYKAMRDGIAYMRKQAAQVS